MKPTLYVLAAILAAAAPVRSQDSEPTEVADAVIQPDPAVEATIPPVVTAGSSRIAPKEELPEFDVKSTSTRQVDVVKPPPMSGLPPVTGTITETVQVVEDPKLPEPVEPLSATSPQDPAVIARFKELARSHQATRMVFVSATVYDHARTLLTCYPNGGIDRKITVWSNVDFSHFSGYSTYQVKDKGGVVTKYGLFMGLTVEDTKRRAELLAKHGRAYQAPEIPQIPELAASGPAYVVTGGDTGDKELMDLVEGMHALYRTEGARMEEAYQARIKAREELKAYLLANPPKPKDVKIQVWKRDLPATESQQGGAR